MQIRILCVGKLKEDFYQKGCAEYQKRLSRFAKVEIVEVADEPAPERCSAAQQQALLQTEAQRLLDRLKPGPVVALCIEGRQLDSLGFAAQLQRMLEGGTPCVQFLIGGSLGLHSSALARADQKLSLSPLTFPHNLARLVLLEQVYRAMKIYRHEAYHK